MSLKEAESVDHVGIVLPDKRSIRMLSTSGFRKMIGQLYRSGIFINLHMLQKVTIPTTEGYTRSRASIFTGGSSLKRGAGDPTKAPRGQRRKITGKGKEELDYDAQPISYCLPGTTILHPMDNVETCVCKVLYNPDELTVECEGCDRRIMAHQEYKTQSSDDEIVEWREFYLIAESDEGCNCDSEKETDSSYSEDLAVDHEPTGT